jgi:hypothetical protein
MCQPDGCKLLEAKAEIFASKTVALSFLCDFVTVISRASKEKKKKRKEKKSQK